MSTILTKAGVHGATTLATFSFQSLLTSQPRALRSRGVMLALSYLIEDVAANSGDAYLIATFQRFSHYHRQLNRYRRFTPQLAHTFVLGYPDVVPIPLSGVTTVELEEHWPLVHEWVVIGWGPTCAVALVAYDEEKRAPHGISRAFQAVWTTNDRQVELLVRAFFPVLGLELPTVTPDPVARQQTALALQRELPQRLRGIKR
ncbi:MAG: histidine kinase [Chloroflexus sp.]